MPHISMHSLICLFHLHYSFILVNYSFGSSLAHLFMHFFRIQIARLFGFVWNPFGSAISINRVNIFKANFQLIHSSLVPPTLTSRKLHVTPFAHAGHGLRLRVERPAKYRTGRTHCVPTIQAGS